MSSLLLLWACAEQEPPAPEVSEVDLDGDGATEQWYTYLYDAHGRELTRERERKSIPGSDMFVERAR